MQAEMTALTMKMAQGMGNSANPDISASLRLMENVTLDTYGIMCKYSGEFACMKTNEADCGAMGARNDGTTSDPTGGGNNGGGGPLMDADSLVCYCDKCQGASAATTKFQYFIMEQMMSAFAGMPNGSNSAGSNLSSLRQGQEARTMEVSCGVLEAAKCLKAEPTCTRALTEMTKQDMTGVFTDPKFAQMCTTPVPTTPLPTPDLNNGVWNLGDIQYYRRTVTRDSKSKLMDLMVINETNETELMLVTPLSGAPTPMPPTPPPTPVPLNVVTTVAFVVTTASGFDLDAALLAMGVDKTKAGVAVVAVYTVQVVTFIAPAPTEAEALDAYAVLLAMSRDKITVTIVAGSGGRRLQTGATVTAVGETANSSVADTATSSASDVYALQTALKDGNSAKFAAVQAEVKQAPSVQAGVQITQTAPDATTAAQLAGDLEAKLTTSQGTIAAAAGAQSASGNTVVNQIPTPMPTRAPTNMPTALPAGFTFAPTKMPTGTPTKMPTGMPTKMPTATPTPVPPTSSPTQSPTNSSSSSEAEEAGANLERAGMLTVALVAFTPAMATTQ
jgi:hypothetical protein